MNPRLRRLLLMVALPAVLIVAGLWYWVHSSRYQDTDNAYVVADQVNVAPQIAGRVLAVPVVQNQSVAAGDVLLSIDPQPFQIALDQANANLENTRSQIQSQQATYKQALAARDDAALQLSYATLKAPAAGVVTEVDIKPGDIVAAGHPVF